MRHLTYADPAEEHLVYILLSLKEAANEPIAESTLSRSASPSSSGEWGDPTRDAPATDWAAQVERERAKGKLSGSSTAVLKRWLFDHSSSPYPTETEKHQLMAATGLSIVQVNNWMSNARRRILKKHRFTRPTRKGERVYHQ